MKPYYEDGPVTVFHGDCLDILRELDDNSVDSVVTDPPYGLEFMGKDWDRPWMSRGDNPGGAGMSTGGFASGNGYANRKTPAYGRGWRNLRCRKCDHITSGASPCKCAEPDLVSEGPGAAPAMRAFQDWCEQWAAECLRVLKPGGHMLAFGGSRTWHRLASGIEDAGFEIRDSIAWLYGSGFPKSLDVSKAIDKRGGNPGLGQEIGVAIKSARESRGWTKGKADAHFCDNSTMWSWYEGRNGVYHPPTPADFARVVAEWPELAEWAEAVAEVEREVVGVTASSYGYQQDGSRWDKGHEVTTSTTESAKQWEGWGTALKPAFEPVVVARKPLAGTVAANVLAYGTGALNIASSRVGDEEHSYRPRGTTSNTAMQRVPAEKVGMSGEATTVAGRWPTNVVLDESQAAAVGEEGRFFPTFRYEAKAPTSERPKAGEVQHPTVKPLDLMRWLVRLVTPPGGVVLEPFAGSGTTLEAAVLEGFQCVGIEREADYLPLIEQRLAKPMQQGLFDDLEGIA